MEIPIRRDYFFGNLGIPEYPKILLWMVAKSESPVENGGKHPMIYRVSTIRLVVQDFATINSRKPYPLWNLLHRLSPTARLSLLFQWGRTAQRPAS